MKSLILSNFLNPVSDTECDVLLEQLLYIEDGVVQGLYSLSDRDLFGDDVKFYDYSEYMALPVFYDMHFHWVQDDVRQMPKDNLLRWLEKYTWPYEHKFQDENYSLERADKFSRELLRVGTLGGACYSSIHAHTVDHALKYFKGDFIVGNVLMTMNSPDYLLQTEEEAISTVEELAQRYTTRYALTPRFAITTSARVMQETAKLAAKYNTFVQTHLSETENEIDFVLSIYRKMEEFQDVPSYTEIYARCNHLGPKTIMGHGIYLSEEELERLAQTDTVIAHCPTSNGPIQEGGLGSGLFDFQRCEKFGIRWVLGSDIGAGPFLSMFDVMRSFVEQNRAINRKQATYTKALFRATRMGELILHPDSSVSYLASGSHAKMNFLSLADWQEGMNSEEFLEKLISKTPRQDYEKLIKQVWLGDEFLF